MLLATEGQPSEAAAAASYKPGCPARKLAGLFFLDGVLASVASLRVKGALWHRRFDKVFGAALISSYFLSPLVHASLTRSLSGDTGDGISGRQQSSRPAHTDTERKTS